MSKRERQILSGVLSISAGRRMWPVVQPFCIKLWFPPESFYKVMLREAIYFWNFRHHGINLQKTFAGSKRSIFPHLFPSPLRLFLFHSLYGNIFWFLSLFSRYCIYSPFLDLKNFTLLIKLYLMLLINFQYFLCSQINLSGFFQNQRFASK